MTTVPESVTSYLAEAGVDSSPIPTIRPRRLRSTPAMRALVRETHVDPAKLIWPVFVRDDIDDPREIAAMPGQYQHTIDSLRRAAAEAAEAGVGAIDLFGVPSHRDGHCGLLDSDGGVDNDATLPLYQAMAISQARAGAHMVSPSGMMDGQVAAIRAALDQAGYAHVAILAYSAKYASAYFGPFREAVGSTLKGDRRTYQQDPANRREGLFEALLDAAEGADMLMVKPAGPYLDVLADVAAASDIPVAAYQVSGEYAMVEAAAANGWIDRTRVIDESLTGIFRAGADSVLTYWALEVARRAR